MNQLIHPAYSLKRTKIIATIGPATESPKMLEELINSGLNVARLNFSHGTHEWHLKTANNIKKIAEKLKKPIAIMQDLQGPKFRIGTLLENALMLHSGQKAVLFHGEIQTDERIPVPLDMFPYLKINDRILINDGRTRLSVLRVDKHKKEAVCVVKAGNLISSKKGINIPDTKLPPMSLTEKDLKDLTISEQLDADFVALSFVQDVDDIYKLRELVSKMKNPPKIVVKLETREAVRNLEHIIKEADVVMVARGDLAVEMEPENVPLVQRQVIKLARKYHTPVIIATQMLESMVENPEPTRAEVNDVATAVLDHVDAIMLSAETATGMYPIDAIAMQKRIIKRVERHRHELHVDFALDALEESNEQTTAVAAAACILAHQLRAALIVVSTSTGRCAGRVASYRPTTPIIAVTDNIRTWKQLALVWGVKAFCAPTYESREEMFRLAKQKILKLGYAAHGEKVVFVSGLKQHSSGSTNSITVETL